MVFIAIVDPISAIRRPWAGAGAALRRAANRFEVCSDIVGRVEGDSAPAAPKRLQVCCRLVRTEGGVPRRGIMSEMVVGAEGHIQNV